MPEFSKVSFQKGGLNVKLAEILTQMLDKAGVDAVLAPAQHPRSKGVMQTLISDGEQTAGVDPFAPVVPVNSAKIASSLTARPSNKNVAMLLRSCEVRALIELVKLQQAVMDNVILIGMDCVGRFENSDFLSFVHNGGSTEAFWQGAEGGSTRVEGYDLASACTICEHPVPENVDIRLCLLGSGPESLCIEWVTDAGRDIGRALGLETGEAPGKRKDAVDKLVAARSEARDRKLSEFREAVPSLTALDEHLRGCVTCANCRVACPVCYCKECVFLTDTFRHTGEQYLMWAQRDGALKMPTDTVFYHLTRLIHMSALCVGCGQCTSACPNGIELMPLFRSVAEKTQARFGYQAGRSLDEEQPLAVFFSDELTEVTGQVK